MTEKRFAVIVGVDDAGDAAGLPALRHAEDDARAICAVLCDERIGSFDRDDVTLLTGAGATAERVKAALVEAVGKADESDVLVVYFAGHSLNTKLGQAVETYLVTAGVLAHAPDAGLGISILKHYVEAFSGKALLILDCCSAGTFLNAAALDVEMVSVESRVQRRYTALMACEADNVAREDEELGHGVLTYHILQGMRGEAADRNGEVSFLGLGNYVVNEHTISPEPGFFSAGFGCRTVLTRPGPPARGRHAAQPPPDTIKSAPLENPLDPLVPTIRWLIQNVARGVRGVRPLVEHLKAAMNADAVAVLEHTAASAGFSIIDATPGFDREYVQDLLRARDSLDRLWYGHRAWDEDDRRSLLSVPLQREPGKVVLLAVQNPAPELGRMGEPVAKILQTVWRTHGKPPDEVEMHVLTDLRRAFRLPAPLYERYRQLQRKVLESLTIVFQPIVTLEKVAKHVGVHSFEALARRTPKDPAAEMEMSAPVELLVAARAWGDRLVIERDEIIVAKALAAYASAHHQGPWDVPKPVSVNVAVRSLLSDSYVASLKAALDATGLNPEHVTLEISEQDPIRPRTDEKWPGEPHAYFHERLTDIGREVGVSFAVDDFGSDYASVSRMAGLPLTQIKIDRQLLHHPTALKELKFVQEVARDGRDRGTTPSRVVIVEGVDDQSPITLRQIYDLKIRHVQGYIVRDPAAATLRQLPEDVREDIAARVRGDDENRKTGLARGDSPRGRRSLRRSA